MPGCSTSLFPNTACGCRIRGELELSVKSAELEKTDRLSLLFRAAQDQALGVVVILEGTGLPGIIYTVEELSSCLDPRHFEVHHFPGAETAPERKDLFLHHYWLNLPRYGDLAVFDGSYYHDWAVRKSANKLGNSESRNWIEDINNFEHGLHQNRYLVLKIRIQRDRKDLQEEMDTDKRLKIWSPLLGKRAKYLIKHHKEYSEALELVVENTNVPDAPWFTPPPEKGKHVRAHVLDYLIARLEEALSVDSRQAVASYDEAMALMRNLKSEASQ